MIRDIPNRLSQGVRGLVYWAPFAWRWRSWDYGWALGALDHALKALEVACREGHHVNGERDARQIRVARELLARARDDLRIPYKGYVYEVRRFKGPRGGYEDLIRPEYLFWHEREEANWNELFDYLKKNMRRWWD